MGRVLATKDCRAFIGDRVRSSIYGDVAAFQSYRFALTAA